MKYLAVRNAVTGTAIYTNEVVYALHCHLCGAEDESRRYVWKHKERWVPFYLCLKCLQIICEECLDTTHHEARYSIQVREGDIYSI